MNSNAFCLNEFVIEVFSYIYNQVVETFGTGLAATLADHFARGHLDGELKAVVKGLDNQWDWKHLRCILDLNSAALNDDLAAVQEAERVAEREAENAQFLRFSSQLAVDQCQFRSLSAKIAGENAKQRSEVATLSEVQPVILSPA